MPRLNILIVDPDDMTSQKLQVSLRSMHRTISSTTRATTLSDAKRLVLAGHVDIIYMDPLSMDVDLAGEFILTTDRDFPIVFVLFMSFAEMHRRDNELFRGERKKLRRYFRLNKETPQTTIADEVEATLQNCLYDLELWAARGALRRYNERFPMIEVEEDLCFVIMTFSKEKKFQDLFRFGIKAAVEHSGYRCVRVDRIEHNGRITDLMLQQLESARFIVADLTEARPNCYYELGWAHRAKKNVILTIPSSDSIHSIHFDVKDYNFLVYEFRLRSAGPAKVTNRSVY